ncbi:MBG domain-containing protein, partial [Pedobacter cryoconitis]
MKKRLRSSSLFEKKRLLSVLVLLFAFLTLKAQTTLSTSPTLIFNTTEATVIGTIATDGSGGSVNISDLDLQIFAGTKANGTLLPNQNVEYHNNAWFASSNSFFGITPNSANIEAEGYQALIIKSSSQANNFSLKSLQLYDWGGNTPVILEAYDGGVSKGTVEIAFVNGVAKTLTQSDLLSSTALQSIDEVRIYGKNNLGIWMSVNNIQVAPPVAPDITPPTVTSINRVGTTPTNASGVIYTVIFSESVTGVTADDFALTTSGSASGTIASITGSGTTYTVTVNNTGDGTLKLDLNSSGTGIKDLANNLITTGYTTGQLFTIDRTPPETTITSFPPAATTSNSFTFMYSSSESPATYQAKEDISPVYASGNNFYPMRNLPAGNHTFSVAAVDAAGNIDPTPATYTWKVQAIPRLTASSGSTIFTEGNNTISIPIAIDAAMTLNNPDNVQLISTTVQIAANLDATQDILTFVNNGVTMGNIVSDPYNTATGTIILRSTTATSAEWLAAIRSITYTNSSETPGIGNRTISFLISDGINTIPGVNKVVNVVSVNDAPIVTASSGTTVFVQTNVIVDNGITISDADNTTLASANIRILTGQPQDVLSFINNDATLYGNITGNYIGPTRSMNLASSGNTATIAQWQAVLRAITFSTTSINTSNRVVTFFVNDGAANSNSTTKTLTITVPISISPATLPAASAGATYNQTLSATGNTAPYSFAITNGTLPAGLTLHASGLLSGTPTETGTFSITITATSATSFTGSKAYSFVINPGVQTITMNTVATATYGNADIDPGATATSLLPVTYTSGDLNIATIINNKIHILKAGIVTINANQPGNGTFSAAAQVQQVLTVLPAPLTITADSYNKIYGAALPALTYSMTGFVNGDTFASLTTQPTLTTTAVRGSSVAGGPYAITPGGAVAANYTISYIPGSLTVTPAALIITATNKSKLYGAALPALNVTLRGVVNNDTFESLTAQLTLSTTATAASSVAGSPYVITPRGAIATNYTISYVSGNLTVIPAALTITAGSKNKIYGAALPALTYSATGFVNGDTFARLTTQPVLSTIATAASSVAGNPYAITVSGAVSTNYNISYMPGSLTVTPAALTITADNQTKGYGAALPTLTASASGFVNGDTFASLTTQPVLSTTATAASSVAGSPYVITPSGAVSANYSINYVPGNLTVDPAALTITADNQTKGYGAALPTLTASASGFVNGDTFASLTTQPVLSTTATAAS